MRHASPSFFPLNTCAYIMYFVTRCTHRLHRERRLYPRFPDRLRPHLPPHRTAPAASARTRPRHNPLPPELARRPRQNSRTADPQPHRSPASYHRSPLHPHSHHPDPNIPHQHPLRSCRRVCHPQRPHQHHHPPVGWAVHLRRTPGALSYPRGFCTLQRQAAADRNYRPQRQRALFDRQPRHIKTHPRPEDARRCHKTAPQTIPPNPPPPRTLAGKRILNPPAYQSRPVPPSQSR